MRKDIIMEKIKVLVLCSAYPDLNGSRPLNYVHERNKEYIKHNIDVIVLNFNASTNYVMDGIRVIPYSKYQKVESYDWLICHAPNIRNHYIFLRKYHERFEHIMFVFHGHEIVKIGETYPKPFDYQRKGIRGKTLLQNLYDNLKLRLWRNYFPQIYGKSELVFVSKLLYEDFCEYVMKGKKICTDHIHIIPNSVGRDFLQNRYNTSVFKKYDFITIRSNMDSSVYCMDIVTELAKRYPNYKFLVVGKGNWFKYNKRPSNITWIDKVLSHDELLRYIDNSRVALMPTRRDSQGIMTCELLTYGIPVITSDLDICKEITKGFSNAYLVSNDIDKIDLDKILNVFEKDKCEWRGVYQKYSPENTTKLEIRIIKM